MARGSGPRKPFARLVKPPLTNGALGAIAPAFPGQRFPGEGFGREMSPTPSFLEAISETYARFPSVLVEVLLDLEGHVLALERTHFRALDHDVFPGERVPERGAQDLVALERVEGLGQGGRQPPDPASRPLGLGQGVGVDQGRLPWIK